MIDSRRSSSKMLAHLCQFSMLLALLLLARAEEADALMVGPPHHRHERTSTIGNHRHLIVGGHDAVQGRYPYFVSLDYNDGVVLNGALIAPDFVLTAGHCLENNSEELTVRVGTYSLSHDNTNGTDGVDVVEIGTPILHPDFDRFQLDSFRHDFLLFQLLNASSKPVVKINRDPNLPAHQQEIVIMGLGWTTVAYQSPADTLQVANLTALSNGACSESHDPARGISYAGLIDETMLCTGAPPNNTRDGCAWDSGAPCIVPDSHGDPGNDILVGLGM